MTKNNGFKLAALAASIALAMAATSAMAADPASTALPGQGKVTAGAAVATMGGTTTNPTLGIAVTGSTVINWGQGTTTADINNTGTAGFNVGSAATVNFTGADGVLNIDSTGNASQIFGTLTSVGNVYVANANGIVVGSKAAISSTADVGLIANSLGTSTFAGTATPASLEFQGSGGNVSVATGATIGGANVLVSGGGMVNVDLSTLTSGNATIEAGVKNSTSTLVNNNTSAVLTATGDLGGATLTSFASAGDASTSGTLTLGSNAAVGGNLTNTGTLTLASGFAIDGGLVNNKTATASAAVSAGSITNNGAFDATNFQLTTTAGGLTNGGQMTNVGGIDVTGGDFTNNGQFASNGDDLNVTKGNLVNGGKITGDSDVYVSGGNVTNNGSMAVDYVQTINGSIVNNGTITDADEFETYSDATLSSFTPGASYSITNAGTITSPDDLYFEVNDQYNQSKVTTGDQTLNGSGGGFFNTGTLQVNSASEDLEVYANNNISLGGTIQTNDGTTVKGLSATNSLDGLTLEAGNYNYGAGFTGGGTVTLTTDLFSSAGATVAGNQVKLMSNLSSVDSTGAGASTVAIVAGPQQASDYAVRVAAGMTVTAGTITVDGDTATTTDNPNVIVQGTLMANTLDFGGTQSISDLLSGPAGSLVATGATPTVDINFTGAVKTAKYNNSSNFRFNDLPISLTSDATAPLALTLNPTAYATNGTTNGGNSAVNVLVNGDVQLTQGAALAGATIINGTGSAVTGVSNVPNTHLVLQSTGNISTSGAYYWPGYVYLGNISADASGNAQPGTLGLGTITFGGDFSNVLPGDIAGASGIHLITQFPLSMGAFMVTTNDNAWINFGTDLLTSKYSSQQNATTGPFFGGTQGNGTVVNYGVLGATDFVSQPPSADQ